MSENLTAKAMDRMYATLVAGSNPCSKMTREQKEAVCMRAKRMEEALKFYASRDLGDSDGGNAAKLALAYDPLTTPTREQMLSAIRAKKRHSQYKHGMYGTPPYKKWMGMKRRCQNPNDKRYKDYGGAGIRVCKKWQDFAGFWDDMKATYFPGASLDRYNNRKGYNRSNCRWIPLSEQSKNRRVVRWYWYRGARRTIREIAELRGIKEDTLFARLIRYKWPLERAVALPPRYGKRYAV